MSKSTRQGSAARAGRGHPRREARRQRAAERLAAHTCGPACKRFRKVLVRTFYWVDNPEA